MRRIRRNVFPHLFGVFFGQQWEPGGQPAYEGGSLIYVSKMSTLEVRPRIDEDAFWESFEPWSEEDAEEVRENIPANAAQPFLALAYLLDTNGVRYVMASRPSIMARVRDAGGLGVLSVSAITVAELYLGVAILPEGRRKATLLASLDRVLTRGIDVRPLSGAAARICGTAGAALRSAGVSFSFQDLAIASIAIAENSTVAYNDRFFEDAQRVCGLRFEA